MGLFVFLCNLVYNSIMLKKKWRVLPKITDEFIKEFPDMNPIVLQLLKNRKIVTQASIDEFFNADYIDDVHDPYLLIDMKKAVNRVYKALENNEKVLVYGDYDADGVTSSVLLVEVLESIGIRAEVYIPQREKEGYGLNMSSVQEIINRKFNLVITCDCAVTNVEEVELFNKNNVDVIITDHHKEPEILPNAYAIIHAGLKREKKYPFHILAGVGIAYKFAVGILQSEKCHLSDKDKEIAEKWLLDLVAIGSVADMVPLVGENRTLVKYGLMVMKNKKKRFGLEKLYEISGTNVEKINSTTIGFQIGPRINSAGRIDHANTSFELLRTKNLERAIEIANELNLNNRKRQDITNKILSQAKSQLDCVDKDTKFIWVSDKSWNLGVVGLVAGKLSQEYYRPSFVFGNDGNLWTGSVRGIDEIDLMEIINTVSDKLERYGGHKSAAGLSIKDENFEEVKKRIENEIKIRLKDLDLYPSLTLDCEINLADVDWDLWDYLEKFEPFGMENSRPKFLIKNCKINDISFMGKEDNHLRLQVEQFGEIKKVVGFSMAKNFVDIKNNDIIDMVVELGVNEWNGNRSLEIYLLDFKKCE